MTSYKILKSLTATAALLAAALAAAPERAQASLILDQVTVELDTGGLAGVLTDVVTVDDPIVEIVGGDATNIGGFLFAGESVDIDASSITFVFTGGIGFPWEFRDLQWIDPATGAVVPGLLTGVTATLLGGTFSPFPPVVTILSPPDPNVPQAFRVVPATLNGGSLRLDLTVEKAPPPPPPPPEMAEPGTISLLAVALLGLAVAQWRRPKRQHRATPL